MFIVNGVSGASLHCINFGVATDPAGGGGHHAAGVPGDVLPQAAGGRWRAGVNPRLPTA